MRAFILIAGAALTVSGCGEDQAAENTLNIDATASAQDITSNDTTAIDAATGDDANMAADVDYTLDANNIAGNEGSDAGSTDNSTDNAE